MAKIDKKTKLKLNKKSVRAPSKPTTEKKPKKYVTADTLTWKPVKTSSFSGIDGGGGMMMLEELEDVGIEWEETDGGRKIAKFVEVESKTSKGKKNAAQEEPNQEGRGDDEKASSASETEEGKKADDKEAVEEDDEEEFPDFAGFAEEDLNAADEEEHPNLDDEPAFNGMYMFDDIASTDRSPDDLLPEWSSISLHPSLKRSFLASSFTAPTAIQSRAIPAGITGRDVVGVAETGSGKTLAYSLPILHYLLGQRKSKAGIKRPLSALVLCPTRELALQVMDHLNALLKHALATPDGEKPQGPPRVSVGSVVGGLSAQKQKRILERGCDVIVATPGRLWDLIKAVSPSTVGLALLAYIFVG